MQIFDEMLYCRQQIEELSESLKELRAVAYSPKGQEITGMPHGNGGKASAVETFLIKSEKINSRIDTYKQTLYTLWCELSAAMKSAEISKEDQQAIYYRFYQGLSWKQCVDVMAKKYGGKWNENRTFRVFRKVSSKCTKNIVKIC